MDLQTHETKSFQTIFNNSFTLSEISTFEILISKKLLQLYFRYIQKIISYEKYLSTNNCNNTQQKLFLKVVRNVA